MIVKKAASPSLTPRPQNQNELQVLYARRMAIDALIHSLERYDRYRVQPTEIHKQKTA